MKRSAAMMGAALVLTASGGLRAATTVTTGFELGEGYAVGPTENLAGQNGWVINDPPGPPPAADQLSFFYNYNVLVAPDNVWAALGGRFSIPTRALVSLGHAVDLPFAGLDFSVDFSISSSTIGSRDQFGWSFQSATGDLLRVAAEPDPTNEQLLEIVWYDAGGQRHGLAKKLAYNTIYHLHVQVTRSGADALVVFTVGADFGAPFRFSGALVGQATANLVSFGSDYTVTAASLSDAGDNTLYFDNVRLAPRTAILVQPLAQTREAGNLASLSVGAVGAPPLEYQWFKNGERLAGATQSTLEFTAAGIADSGNYIVEVRSATGFAASDNAYLAVLPTGAASLVLEGRVVNDAGIAVAGATVRAALFHRSVASVQTDADGHYQLPALPEQIYHLSAELDGKRSDHRVIHLAPTTRQQTFQLLPSPPPFPVTTVDAPLPIPYATPADASEGSRLLVFDGEAFTNRPALLNKASMLLVLTHGWRSDPQAWALPLARELAARGISASVNIVAWDWPTVAARPGLLAEAVTSRQGGALGRELQLALGEDYRQPVHFIGHSLGTLVNRYAVDSLRGERTGVQPTAARPWTDFRPHVTVFDEAEIAHWTEPGELAGLVNLEGPRNRRLASLYLSLPYGADAPRWRQSMPLLAGGGGYVENYVSGFGWSHPEAVNVCLQRGALLDPASGGHDYSPKWYQRSVALPTASLAGFRRSEEQHRKDPAISGVFPPPSPLTAGHFFQQVPMSAEELELQSVSAPGADSCFFPAFGSEVKGLIGRRTVASAAVPRPVTVAAVRLLGGATVLPAGESVRALNEAYDSLADRARSGVTTVWNLGADPGPGFALMGSATGLSAAVVTLTVPAGVDRFSFDYVVHGDAESGVLVFGMETNTLFALPQNVVPRDEPQTSPLFAVPLPVGGNREFTFAMTDAGNSDITVRVGGFRFYSLASPGLLAESVEGSTVLSWTDAANGYELEATADLGAGPWTAVTRPPALSGGRFRVSDDASEPVRYFRLRLP